jgi:hypothetical protein
MGLARRADRDEDEQGMMIRRAPELKSDFVIWED